MKAIKSPSHARVNEMRKLRDIVVMVFVYVVAGVAVGAYYVLRFLGLTKGNKE